MSASSLTWLDHDAAERDRMQHVLALFKERDTRDELGLGAIRDSFGDLRLTRAEAEFLHDRICERHGDSLLAHLVATVEAAGPPPDGADAPWKHPEYASFPARHRELLRHGRLFSTVMYGAAVLYNLMLAEAADGPDVARGYRHRLDDWARQLDRNEVAAWKTAELWRAVQTTSHTITLAARRFVEGWLGRVLAVPASPAAVADDEAARRREGPDARGNLTHPRRVLLWRCSIRISSLRSSTGQGRWVLPYQEPAMERPDWWDWELGFTSHLESRMEERGFSEVDLRAMLEDTTAIVPSRRPGRWIVRTHHGGEPWSVVVEPDPDELLLMVVSAYRRAGGR